MDVYITVVHRISLPSHNFPRSQVNHTQTLHLLFFLSLQLLLISSYIYWGCTVILVFIEGSALPPTHKKCHKMYTESMESSHGSAIVLQALYYWSLVFSHLHLTFFLHITVMPFPWDFLYWQGQMDENPTCSFTPTMSLHTTYNGLLSTTTEVLIKIFSCSYSSFLRKCGNGSFHFILIFHTLLLSFTHPASTKAWSMGWCRGRGYFVF